MRRQVAQFTAVASARFPVRAAATLLMLAALAASAPSGVAAQSAFGAVSIGDRIRISAAPLGTSARTGQVVAASEDTLVVRTKENGRDITRAIPRDQITRLDVSTGTGRGYKSQLAGFGFLVGAGVAKYIHRNDEVGPAFFEGAADDLTDLVLLGGLGAGVGAYLGRARESWRGVPLGAPRVSLSLPRSGRGVGMRASFAF
jgi:hypothetical protein